MVDNDGTRISGNLFSVGSGSTFAYGMVFVRALELLTCWTRARAALEIIWGAFMTLCLLLMPMWPVLWWWWTGILDTYYHYDMTVDEAVDMAKRAIYHATHHDCFSGGMVRGWFYVVAALFSCCWETRRCMYM